MLGYDIITATNGEVGIKIKEPSGDEVMTVSIPGAEILRDQLSETIDRAKSIEKLLADA